MASSSKETESFWNMIPPGYRFEPRDEELITHYLIKKINGEALPPNKMHEAELYGVFSPEELTPFYDPASENNWYFFTRLERLYENGSRPKRSAGNGYWKTTGKEITITNEQGNIIGFRKALSFFVGNQPKGIKTSWLMHEFRLNNVPSTPEPKPKKHKTNDHDGVHSTTTSQSEGSKPKNMLDGWVLCKVYKLARDVAVEPPNPGAQEEHYQAIEQPVAQNGANGLLIPAIEDIFQYRQPEEDLNMSLLKPSDILDFVDEDALYHPHQQANNALLSSTIPSNQSNMDIALQQELLPIEEDCANMWQPQFLEEDLELLSKLFQC